MDPLILGIVTALIVIWVFVGKVVYDQIQYDHLQNRAVTGPRGHSAGRVLDTAVRAVSEPETDEDGSQVTRSDTGELTWRID